MGKRSALVLAAVIGLGMVGASARASVPNFKPGFGGNNGPHQPNNFGFGDKGNKGPQDNKGPKGPKGGLDLPGFGNKGPKGDKGDKGKGPGNLFGDKGHKHDICYQDPCQKRHVDHCGWGVGPKGHDHNCDPAAVPLPAAAWSGLSTMFGGLGIAGFRKLRRKTA